MQEEGSVLTNMAQQGKCGSEGDLKQIRLQGVYYPLMTEIRLMNCFQ